MTQFCDFGHQQRENNQILEQFLKFCRDNDVIQAEYFVNALNLTNLNEQDEDGLTPLQITAAYGHVELTENLLHHGAYVDLANNYGFTPLHHAALNGNSEILSILLKFGADIECRNYSGASALFLASKRGHLDAVRVLLEHGAEVEPDDDDGYFECSPLIAAVSNDHENVARLLIENGAFVNRVIESTGYTPLMYAAASKAQLTTVQLLLDRGADVDSANAVNKSAMDLALTRRCNDVIALLEQCTNHGRSRSNTLVSSIDLLDIVEAVKLEEIERVAEILRQDQKQADYVKPDDGCTPLILASMLGNVDLVRLLLQKGAGVDRRDKLKGWTALMQACFFRKIPVAKYLIRWGADVNVKSDDGYTALDLAIVADNGNTPDDGLLALLSQKSVEQDLTFSPGGTGTRRSYSLPRKRTLMNFLAKKWRSPTKTTRNFTKPKIWWNKFKNRLRSRTNSMTSLSTLNRINANSANIPENHLFIDPSRSMLNTSFFFGGSTKDMAMWKSQSVFDLQTSRYHVTPLNSDQILGSNTINFEHFNNNSQSGMKPGLVVPPFHPTMTFGPVDPKTKRHTLPTPILSAENLAKRQICPNNNKNNKSYTLKSGTSLNALDSQPNNVGMNSVFYLTSALNNKISDDNYSAPAPNNQDKIGINSSTSNTTRFLTTSNLNLNLNTVNPDTTKLIHPDTKLLNDDDQEDTVGNIMEFGGFRSLAMYNAFRMRPAKKMPNRISPMHKYENIMAALNLPPDMFQGQGLPHCATNGSGAALYQHSPNSSLVSVSTTSSSTVLLPNNNNQQQQYNHHQRQQSPGGACVGSTLKKRMPYVGSGPPCQQGPVIIGPVKKRNPRGISRPHSYHDAVSDGKMYNTLGPAINNSGKSRTRPNLAAVYMRPHSYHDPDNHPMFQNCLNFNNLPITPTRKSTFQFLDNNEISKFNSTPHLLAASSPNESTSGGSSANDKNKRLSQLTADLSMMSNRFSSTDTLKLDEEHMEFIMKQISGEPFSSVLDDEELDLDTFVTLTDGDLREMGIQDPGPRNEILKLVRQVNSMIQQKKAASNQNKKHQQQYQQRQHATISESADPLLIPLD